MSVTYYIDSVNGLSSNDGLTWQTALNNIKDLYETSKLSTNTTHYVYLAEGAYEVVQAFLDSAPAKSEVNIIGKGSKTRLYQNGAYGSNVLCGVSSLTAKFIRLIYDMSKCPSSTNTNFFRCSLEFHNCVITNVPGASFGLWLPYESNLIFDQCIQTNKAGAIRTDQYPKLVSVTNSYGGFASGYGTSNSTWDKGNNVLTDTVSLDDTYRITDLSVSDTIGVYAGVYTWELQLITLALIKNIYSTKVDKLEWEFTAGVANLYDIYRNGVKIKSVSNTNFLDEGLSPETDYDYVIKSKSTLPGNDYESLISSNKISFTTPQSGFRLKLNEATEDYELTLEPSVCFDSADVDYDFYTAPGNIKVKSYVLNRTIGGQESNLGCVELINSFEESHTINLRIFKDSKEVVLKNGVLVFEDANTIENCTKFYFSFDGVTFVNYYPLEFNMDALSKKLIYFKVVPQTLVAESSRIQFKTRYWKIS